MANESVSPLCPWEGICIPWPVKLKAHKVSHVTQVLMALTNELPHVHQFALTAPKQRH